MKRSEKLLLAPEDSKESPIKKQRKETNPPVPGVSEEAGDAIPTNKPPRRCARKSSLAAIPEEKRESYHTLDDVAIIKTDGGNNEFDVIIIGLSPGRIEKSDTLTKEGRIREHSVEPALALV